MEYTTKLQDYSQEIDAQSVAQIIEVSKSKIEVNNKPQTLKTLYSCLDLTSLSECDSEQSINEFATKVASFAIDFKGLDNVASVCVYPPFVDVVGLALGNSNVAITSVSAGFPSSQTFLEVKMLETAMAVENGADEIDVVINVGQFLSGQYESMANELAMLKSEIGDDVVFKVILETGSLKTADNIYKAAVLAMLAGADFVKTSTGKTAVSATPEAVSIMCLAVKKYYETTGKMVGIKVAGGVRTTEDALQYYSIVEQVLGEEWLNAELFRIGASSLANDLLSSIIGRSVQYF